jgi:hypothetical protein
LRSIIQKRREQNKGKRAVLKGQFHISTEELRSQVVEAEAATATALQKSKISKTPQPTSIIDLIDDESEEASEESEEEPFDDDIDELG